MKKLFLITFLIVFSKSQSQNQWVYVSTIPYPESITAISVVNQNVIWICTSNFVYKTTDGGQSWLLRRSGLPITVLEGISALDTSKCWIGTVSSIYVTSDGGNNWGPQFVVHGSLFQIKMFTSNYGVASGKPTSIGQQFQFRYTTNGGTNWFLSPNSPISGFETIPINSWDWLDTTTFWIGSANLNSGSNTVNVYKTIIGFGGGGWTSSTILGNGSFGGLWCTAIGFTNFQNGMAGLFPANVKKTTDGGVTWQNTSPILGLTDSFTVNNIYGMKDGSNTTIVSIDDGIKYCFRTTDLGITWIQEILPPEGISSGFTHMQFINPNLGFAGGKNGKFFRYGNPSSINLINDQLPSQFKLEQNFPNPFNPTTTINFSIPKSSKVTLKVYDALGKEVVTLLDEFKPAGNYSSDFTAGANLNSGVYFYTLTTDNFSETKKLMLLK